MRAMDLLEIIEAAYCVEVAPEVWLRGVLAAAGPHLDVGLGTAAYFVDAAAPDEFVTSGHVAEGFMGSPEGIARFHAWDRSVPVAVKRHIHLFGSGGNSATIPPLPTDPELVERTRRAHHYPDMLGVNAIDASGRGCALVAAMPRGHARCFPFGSKGRLDRVAAHLAAGARLCRAGVRRGEAVISPSGKIEHAEGAARITAAHDALRSAAVQIDRLRARPRRLSAEEVTRTWQGLIAGGWSLIDTFEMDGRRYYIAHPNNPRTPRQDVLSEREAQTVGAAAMGHSNKAIAYRLGLSTSSVATHLRRARTKLGVDSRAELIRAYHELLRRAASAASAAREPTPSFR